MSRSKKGDIGLGISDCGLQEDNFEFRNSNFEMINCLPLINREPVEGLPTEMNDFYGFYDYNAFPVSCEL